MITRSTFLVESHKLTKVGTLTLLGSLLAVTDLLVLAHSPLSFLSLGYFLLVPGFLLLRLLAPQYKGWVAGVFSLVLSLFLLMISGLAINSLLPLLGEIRPLTTTPVLLTLNVLILALGACYALRNTSLQLGLPSTKQVLFALLVGVIPLITAAGAIRLSNGASNNLAMIGIAVLAFAFVAMLIGKRRESSYLTFLYGVAVASLFIWALRSHHLAGTDIGFEHHVYNLTHDAGQWSITAFRDPYNACLSITLLPTMLNAISAVSGEWLLKFWYPALFAAIAPLLFSLFRRYLSPKFAFMAAFFFVAQSSFIYWMPMLARQETALLLLAAIMFVVLDTRFTDTLRKKILVIILFATLVMSHYSSAYIALFLLFIPFVLYYALRAYQKTSQSQPRPGYILSGTMLGLFFLLTMLWQLQITYTTGNLQRVAEKTAQTLLGEESASQSTSVTKLFSWNPFRGSDGNEAVKAYVSYQRQQLRAVGASKEHNQYHEISGRSLPPLYSFENLKPANSAAGFLLTQMTVIAGIVVRVSLAVGMVILLFRRKNSKFTPLKLYSVGCVGLLALFVALPAVAVSFNIERLYQTLLVIIAVPIIMGLVTLWKTFVRKTTIATFGAAAVILVFFGYTSGFIPQFSGGQPSAHLNNNGRNFSRDYTHTGEVAAAEWLTANRASNATTHTDVTKIRILQSYANNRNISQVMLPGTIKKHNYVYLGTANKVTGVIFAPGTAYQTPTDYYDFIKNSVYTSRQAEIYR